MQGCTDENSPRESVDARIATLEQDIARLHARLETVEQQLSQFPMVRRQLEMKSARGGEITSRIAQRLAKCEAAIEILAQTDDPEMVDHA